MILVNAKLSFNSGSAPSFRAIHGNLDVQQCRCRCERYTDPPNPHSSPPPFPEWSILLTHSSPFVSLLSLFPHPTSSHIYSHLPQYIIHTHPHSPLRHHMYLYLYPYPYLCHHQLFTLHSIHPSAAVPTACSHWSCTTLTELPWPYITVVYLPP